MGLTINEQIWQLINIKSNILITFKKNYSIDSIAAALSLKQVLDKFDKKVTIACDDFTLNAKVKFLPCISNIEKGIINDNVYSIILKNHDQNISDIKHQLTDNFVKITLNCKDNEINTNDVVVKKEKKYDLIIVIDTVELDDLGKIYDNNTNLFFEIPIINIDHVADNEKFGQVNNIDLTSTSSAEIIFDIINHYNKNLINPDIATCLLAGIIAHTKGFQTFQITPKSLNTVSELLALGARREEIIEHLFRTKDLATLRIWGKVLLNLKYDPLNKIVWSTLINEDFKETKANTSSLPEVIDELIANAPEAKIIVLIYETHTNKFDALIYSQKNLNVLNITQVFTPIGNKNMAQIQLDEKSINIATEKIITEIRKKIKEIPVNNR